MHFHQAQETSSTPSSLSLESQLKLAIEFNDLTQIKKLIAQGVNVNQRIDNSTFLHLAAGQGNENVVRTLIDNNASIIYLAGALTPAHRAIYHNNIPVLKCLLENRADPCTGVPNSPSNSLSLLQAAVTKENPEMIKLLFEYDAKITPSVSQAIERKYGQPIQKIMYNLVGGWSPTKNSWVCAVLENKFDSVAELLKAGANINQLDVVYQKPALYIAALQRNYDMVDFLISRGAVVDEKTVTFDTSREIIDLFLSKLTPRAAFILAVQEQKYNEVLNLVLDQKVNVNTPVDDEGNTLLHRLVQKEKWEDIKALLPPLIQCQMDVNAKNIVGKTPLDFLLINPRRPIEILTLLVNKADISLKGNNQCQELDELLIDRENVNKPAEGLLEITRKKQRAEVLSKQALSPVSLQNNDNLLHIAVQAQDFDQFKSLIEKQADINAVNEYGSTALHTVTKRLPWSVAVPFLEILWENGANANIKNTQGETPLQRLKKDLRKIKPETLSEEKTKLFVCYKKIVEQFETWDTQGGDELLINPTQQEAPTDPLSVFELDTPSGQELSHQLTSESEEKKEEAEETFTYDNELTPSDPQDTDQGIELSGVQVTETDMWEID